MALGYDGKLYILAFDHRGSFQKKMFGIEGDPTPEETETITDAKKLIFEGMEKAVERGVDAVRGRRARRRAVRLATSRSSRASTASRSTMPVEKSGQNEFDFQYGERLRRAHRDVRPATSRRCSSATTRTATPR